MTFQNDHDFMTKNPGVHPKVRSYFNQLPGSYLVDNLLGNLNASPWVETDPQSWLTITPDTIACVMTAAASNSHNARQDADPYYAKDLRLRFKLVVNSWAGSNASIGRFGIGESNILGGRFARINILPDPSPGSMGYQLQGNSDQHGNVADTDTATDTGLTPPFTRWLEMVWKGTTDETLEGTIYSDQYSTAIVTLGPLNCEYNAATKFFSWYFQCNGNDTYNVTISEAELIEI